MTHARQAGCDGDEDTGPKANRSCSGGTRVPMRLRTRTRHARSYEGGAGSQTGPDACIQDAREVSSCPCAGTCFAPGRGFSKARICQGGSNIHSPNEPVHTIGGCLESGAICALPVNPLAAIWTCVGAPELRNPGHTSGMMDISLLTPLGHWDVPRR